MLAVIEFPLWDAPGFGAPSIGHVSTQWSDRLLIRVTLGRVVGSVDYDDPPSLAVSSMDPSLTDTPGRGLTFGVLLEYTRRLSAAQGISTREASELLLRLSDDPGVPTTIIVNRVEVAASRYEIPVTGDWVVTVVDPGYAVCVFGDRGIAVPELETADVTLWEQPLLDQCAEVMRGGA